MKAKRGSVTPATRCRGRCPIRRRRCRFMLANGRQWCRWHVAQASGATASLPILLDGRLTLRQLSRWAAEFDGIGNGEPWPAVEFVGWLADSVSACRTIEGIDGAATL